MKLLKIKPETKAVYVSFCGNIFVGLRYAKDIEYAWGKTAFDNFEKGDGFREYFKELLGNGIFAADGPVWRV